MYVLKPISIVILSTIIFTGCLSKNDIPYTSSDTTQASHYVSIDGLWRGTENRKRTLQVKALTIDARVVGNILSGPSALNDPDRFVWGGSVVKGDDGKYHMLFGTWECGDPTRRIERRKSQ